MNEVTIIIPSVQTDMLLRRCILECRRQAPSANIIVLLDSASKATSEEVADKGNEHLLTVVTGPVTIAAKRNIGAAKSNTKYLAFIDSDAYPDENWPLRGTEVLHLSPDIAIVGGPDLPWPDETGWTRLIGLASRSALVSAKSTYRKRRAKARDCPHLPSCNMIVRRADYLRFGGMAENLMTGEDLEFCYRVRADGGRIRYEPDVAVFHRDRDFGPFIVQRAVYGASVWRLASRGLSFGNLYLFLPALAVLFLASAPLAIAVPEYGIFQWMALALLTILIGVEALRTSCRLADFPGLFAILGIGLLMPGIGTLLGALGLMPNVKSIYRNYPKGDAG